MHKLVMTTKSLAHLPNGYPAKQTVFNFNEEMDIFTFRIPDLFVFAFFATEDGRYVYSKRWGWTFTRASYD
jgi:hypothetical protein